MSSISHSEDLEELRLVRQPPSRRDVKGLQRADAFVLTNEIGDPLPGRSWRELITQSAFLIVMLTLGIGLMFGGEMVKSGGGTPAFVPLFADIFFGAGFTPAVLALWSLATASMLVSEQRKQDLIKVGVSAVFLLIGLGLLVDVAALNDAPYGALVMSVFGGAFVEIVVLVFISKFFFLVEDDAKKIARLEQQLSQLRKSASYGLATSYFYNFIKPVCSHMRLPSENGGTTPIDIEVGRNQFESASLSDSTLYVLVPRDLKAGSDVKGTLKKAQDEKVLLTGKPVPRDGAPATHRPMFLFFVKPRAAQTMHAVDIPTVVSAIRDRADTASEQMLSAKTDAERKLIVQVDIEQELQLFNNTLRELVLNDSRCSQLVKIVVVPALPFAPGALATLDIDAVVSASSATAANVKEKV
jgi:hypothetical protein